MKHKNKCKTCDRCGAEIGKMPDFLNYLIPVKMPVEKQNAIRKYCCKP